MCEICILVTAFNTEEKTANTAEKPDITGTDSVIYIQKPMGTEMTCHFSSKVSDY